MRDPYATPFLVERLAEWMRSRGCPEDQVVDWIDRAIRAGAREFDTMFREGLARMTDKDREEAA